MKIGSSLHFGNRYYGTTIDYYASAVIKERFQSHLITASLHARIYHKLFDKLNRDSQMTLSIYRLDV